MGPERGTGEELFEGHVVVQGCSLCLFLLYNRSGDDLYSAALYFFPHRAIEVFHCY